MNLRSLEDASDDDSFILKKYSHLDRKHDSFVKPAKKNILAYSCLQSKLRCYKLRLNDDPDVCNIAIDFTKYLVINSPIVRQHSFNNNILEINCTKNYITRMAKNRHKKQSKGSPNKSHESTISDSFDKLFNKNEKNVQSKSTTNIDAVKKVDAFQLMMNSRNKSIGTNEEGKEASLEDSSSEDHLRKKEAKKKRLDALQLMANSKGAKNKEIEEIRNKVIEQKMAKRAMRLKSMLSPTGKHSNEDPKPILPKKRRRSSENSPLVSKKPKVNRLLDQMRPTQNNQNITKKEPELNEEDKDFLSKLSPSLKNKGNMLCYLQEVVEKPNKISKSALIDPKHTLNEIGKKKRGRPRKLTAIINDENQSTCTDHSESRKTLAKDLLLNSSTRETKLQSKILSDENQNKDSNSIKQYKSKKNKKNEQKKMSKKVNDQISTDENHSVGLKNESHVEAKKLKRKQLKKNNEMKNSVTLVSNILKTADSDIDGNFIGRPRRSVKKPVKYIDNEDSHSSDDCIILSNEKPKKITPIKILNGFSELAKVVRSPKTTKDMKKPPKNYEKETKHPVKLAAVFSKTVSEKCFSEAKQKFLQSGVPDKIRRAMENIKTAEQEALNFHKVVHVQQRSENMFPFDPWNLQELNLCFTEENELEMINYHNAAFLPKMINSIRNIAHPQLYEINNVKKSLQVMKENYPKFPVYRTYNHLYEKFSTKPFSESNDIFENSQNQQNEISTLAWIDKYQSNSSDEIIGNFNSIITLKKWLNEWKNSNFEACRSQNRLRSDSSDFCDFYVSDSDSKDGLKSLNNVLILSGPCGSGKTSAIYSVAKELSIKILEVNASSKRTGKKLLSDLLEATQSHKVNRSALQKISQNFDEFSQSKNSEKASGMSLILIEDADVVFEQDDGFISGIAQLVQSSKRPVILVTISPTCAHLQRFVNNTNVIKFKQLQPKMLGTWLDILCLVETGKCWPSLGSAIVENCFGDMRKGINHLQFWIDGTSPAAKVDSTEDIEIINENDTPLDDLNAESENHFRDSVCENQSLVDSKTICPLDRTFRCLNQLSRDFFESKTCEDGNNSSMKQITDTLDTLSVIDMMDSAFNVSNTHKKSDNQWAVHPIDSVSDLEVFNNYDWYRSLYDELRDSCIDLAINRFALEKGHQSNSLVGRRDIIMSNNNTLSEAVPPSLQLDRRSMITDYFSQLRSICRIEQERSTNNSKRNNRFCHYLKSLSIACSLDSLQSFCDSLWKK